MTEYERPLYTVYQYGNTGVYKVVKFKRNDGIPIKNEKEKESQSNDVKLQNNLARAKSTVLQLALCNDWQYFVTFTLNKEKYDRYDLPKFQKDLSQWFRDMRKKYKENIRFLYIPEQHSDGAWHAHGVLGNVPPAMVDDFDIRIHPYSLVKSNYKNLPEYEKKFGFISLGLIKSKIATAFYISKYLTKSLMHSSLELGVHTYYSSKGLEKAVASYDVYYEVPELDKALKYHGDFCSVGIIQKKPWHYGLEYNPEFRDIEQMPDSDPVSAVVEHIQKKPIYENSPYDNVTLEEIIEIIKQGETGYEEKV